jgi:hypothetical protein
LSTWWPTVELVNSAAQVIKNQVSHVDAESVAHDDPLNRGVLPSGGQRVRRDEPAARSKFLCEVEDAEVVPPIGELPSDRRYSQVRVAAKDDIEDAYGPYSLGEVGGNGVRGVLDFLIPLFAEAKKIVIGTDDLPAGPREVEIEGRHLSAEVVDVEDQFLRKVLGLAPDTQPLPMGASPVL